MQQRSVKQHKQTIHDVYKQPDGCTITKLIFESAQSTYKIQTLHKPKETFICPAPSCMTICKTGHALGPTLQNIIHIEEEGILP
jgi:hypothetical protein